MKTKVCFKCNRELPLDEFYAHPSMADGRLNKCKDCAKKDVHKNYIKNTENPKYVEKERKRCREKYHRLGYKDIYLSCHKETRNVASYLKKRINIPATYEVHHWNYNLLYDVFIIDRRLHARIHKKIQYDEETKCFKYNGTILNTKEKHRDVIKELENNTELNLIEYTQI